MAINVMLPYILSPWPSSLSIFPPSPSYITLMGASNRSIDLCSWLHEAKSEVVGLRGYARHLLVLAYQCSHPRVHTVNHACCFVQGAGGLLAFCIFIPSSLFHFTFHLLDYTLLLSSGSVL